MPSVVVRLGDFVFGAYEVPREIPFGGTQRLAVHELVGGARVVDALGRSDDDLSWSGLFLGKDALDRARYLDSLRIEGKALRLTWSKFSYQVVIASLKCSFQRVYKLPYAITCKVVADYSQPVTTIAPLGFDAAIMDDLNDAKSLATSINDGPLSGLMTTLDSAIKAVSSVAKATSTAINSVLNPIRDVRARVSVLIAAVGNTINNTATFGGVFGTPSGLQNQLSTTAQVANLYQLDAKLQRMQLNLYLIDRAPNAQTVTVTGGNLYALASKYYDDPSLWNVIAQANGLTDPVLIGTHNLTIPPKPATVTPPVLDLTC